MHRNYPYEPHRGPMSLKEAMQWVKDAVENHIDPDAFYVCAREVGRWERVYLDDMDPSWKDFMND